MHLTDWPRFIWSIMRLLSLKADIWYLSETTSNDGWKLKNYQNFFWMHKKAIGYWHEICISLGGKTYFVLFEQVLFLFDKVVVFLIQKSSLCPLALTMDDDQWQPIILLLTTFSCNYIDWTSQCISDGNMTNMSILPSQITTTISWKWGERQISRAILSRFHTLQMHYICPNAFHNPISKSLRSQPAISLKAINAYINLTLRPTQIRRVRSALCGESGWGGGCANCFSRHDLQVSIHAKTLTLFKNLPQACLTISGAKAGLRVPRCTLIFSS